jgi:ABC-type Mn2+/Zn2+ transport system permease subunit
LGYGGDVTIAIIALLGCVLGYLVGRWWSVALGLVAGALTLATGVQPGRSPLDTPALVVALVAVAALAAGVALRHRMPAQAG